MTSNSEEEHQHALALLYFSGRIIGIIPQTFVYGIYAVLITASSFIMLRQGLATRARRILFGLIIFMFLLSTAYIISCLMTLFGLYKAWFLDTDPDAPTSRIINTDLCNALIYINYIITDGVVVWRVWVLCSADGIKALSICLFMLGLCTASTTAIISTRITLFLDISTGTLFDRLTHVIDILQVATPVMSILTNLLATSIISIKAWRYRIEIRDDLDVVFTRHLTRAGKIFVLLIETGVLYTISCLTLLIAAVIPVKAGTLGDLYAPVNVQFAGIYPIIVLLLITHDKSLDRTVRVFASGVEISDFHISTRQIESGIHFELRQSVLLSTRSDVLEGDGSFPGLDPYAANTDTKRNLAANVGIV
ncbi:hypothetical protein D9757_005038 [Collybiopsis confluens]|uniref:Uncharacterized protein n=1 Tax=Collybiopsis confluens TaxID=2823264 RepID=A0A8H5HTD1_9AGAR|nr:hypothetical protein D9757_005038 [Collybiopsis confluens]